jgi:hypothetical protein
MFDDLDAALSGAIKDVFSEVAVHRPRVSARYVERADDPDRVQHLIYGVFSAGPAEDQLKGIARGAEFSGTSRVFSTSAEFSLAPANVKALTALPAKGDTITLSSRAGCPVYAVSGLQHSDMGDLNLILVREDQPL